MLKPGMVVIDLGANAGYYTFFASHKVKATGKVYAFEPFPAAFAALQADAVQSKHHNIVPLQFAASDRPGKHHMFVMPGHHPSNSLHPVPGLAEDTSVTVEAVRVDDVVDAPRVDVVKIDVEGHELQAMRGMERILRANKDIKLFIEFNPGTLKSAGVSSVDFFDFLAGHGFKLYAINDSNGKLHLADTAARLVDLLPQSGVINVLAQRDGAA
jgi:FkbM family methyltransferase